MASVLLVPEHPSPVSPARAPPHPIRLTQPQACSLPSHGDAWRAEWSRARGHQPRRQPLRHGCFWANPLLHCFPAGLRPGRTGLSGAGSPHCCPNPATFGWKQSPSTRKGRAVAEDPGHLGTHPDGPQAHTPLPPGALPPPPAHPRPPLRDPRVRCLPSRPRGLARPACLCHLPWRGVPAQPHGPKASFPPTRAAGSRAALWSLRTSTFQGLEGFAGHMGWAGRLRNSARAGGAGAQPSGSLLAWTAARHRESVGLLAHKGCEGRPVSFGEGPGGLTLTDGSSTARAAWGHRGARALLKLSPRPQHLWSPVGRLSLGSQDHSSLGKAETACLGPC